MEGCTCECHCFQHVPKTIRESLYQSYEKLNDAEKFIYFYGLIYRSRSRRKKKKTDPIELYHVRVNGYHKTVCQKAFRIIHKLSFETLKKLTVKIKTGLESRETFNFTNKEPTTNFTFKPVRDHISSLLENNEFLGCLKRGEKPNFTRMWQHYKDTYESVPGTYMSINDDSDEENMEEQGKVKIMSLSTYRNICKEMCASKLLELQGDVVDLNSTSDTNVDACVTSPSSERLPQLMSVENLKACRRRRTWKKSSEVKTIRPILPKSSGSNILLEDVEASRVTVRPVITEVQMTPKPALGRVSVAPVEVVYYI